MYFGPILPNLMTEPPSYSETVTMTNKQTNTLDLKQYLIACNACSFLPRNAMRRRVVSVFPFVTFVYSVQTSKHILKRFSPASIATPF